MPRQTFVALLVLSLVISSSTFFVEAAERNSSNSRGLTKKNGPWMIMACSFTVYNAEGGIGPDYQKIVEEQRANGEKAARELVVELKKKLNLDAFVYEMEDKVEEIRTTDRFGQSRVRKIKSNHGQTCVLAGNFDSYDDPKAQEILKKLKVMRPKCLDKGTFQAHSKEFGPMGNAFMTVNPLISPEELVTLERQRDPLIKRLNSGSEYSLLRNPGKYTLILASFKGRSTGVAMSASKEEISSKINKFDNKLMSDATLDKAGYEAWSMAKTLRNQNKEAWVYHDRDKSIVTYGSFDSPDDPKLLKIAEKFKARYETDPATGRQFLTCQMVSTPGKNANAPPEKVWLIDPEPYVMPVPRLR
ncbi:MAG: hypothetical protein KDA68_09630 [Planctomycetaceae bacterium]|nr:hypothetical protein [Planctomycetaceae bacterium]